MSDFDIDAFLGEGGAKDAPNDSGFDIDGFLGAKPKRETETARPAHMEKPAKRPPLDWAQELINEPDIGEDRSSVQIPPEGRWNLREKRWESTKEPIKAVWADPRSSAETPGQQTSPGVKESTAADLASASRPDTMTAGRAALAGGVLQGLTLNNADEIAAAYKSATSPATFEEEQRGNRQAFADAKQGDPKAFAVGKLGGEAALVAANPGKMVMGTGPLLSAGNLARGSLFGSISAMGETEAGGGQAAIDVAKGAGFGLGATAAMGTLGVAAGKVAGYIRTAPERAAAKADTELLDLLTLGAPKTQRDALVGSLGKDAHSILAMVRANPSWESVLKQGDQAAAAELVMAAQRTHTEQTGRFLENLGKRTKGEVDPLVKHLEARRNLLSSNPAPEAQAEAANVQKLIDNVTERWGAPKKPQTPKDGELVSKLLAKADKGDLERAGTYATDYAETAKKYGLDKVADNVPARTKLLDQATRKLEKQKDEIYSSSMAPTKSIDYHVDHPGMKTGWESVDPNEYVRSRKWYHGTSTNSGMETGSTIDPKLGNYTNAVHASPDPRIASNFAKQTARLDGGKPVVYEIEIRPYGLVEKESEANSSRFRWPNRDNPIAKEIDTTDVPNLKLDDSQSHGVLLDDDGQPALAMVNKGPFVVGKETKDKLPTMIGPASANVNNIYVANVTGKLKEWSDQLRGQWGRMADAEAVDAEIAAMQAQSQAIGRPTITPRELRAQVTSLQDNAFSGKYLDPTKQKSMQREISGKLRDVLDEHVEKFGGKALVDKLHQVNREYSAVIAFKDSAQKELAVANLTSPAAPALGTGTVTPADMYRLAQTIKNPETRAVIMGEMYRQIGDPATRLVARQERKGELIGRLVDPLEYLAQRNATSPTTLRAGVNSLASGAENFASKGAMAGGAVATALGGGHVGIPIMAASIAARYGKPVADMAERAAVTMEFYLRKGGNLNGLRYIGEAAKLPKEVTEKLIAGIAPMEAGSRAGTKEGPRKDHR